MHLSLVLDFLRALAADNNKAWMDAHRPDYQRARAEFTTLTTELLRQAQSSLAPELRGLSAQDVMYRLHKNDRSQRDPETYKRHMSMGLKQGGRLSPWAGYYLALEPGGESYVGAGRWEPEPRQLAAIRQEIHYSPDAFHTLRQAPDFVQHFPAGLDRIDMLKTAPKGYDRHDPDIEWLRLKRFFVWAPFTDAEVLRPDFPARVLAAWHAARPFVHFLNEAMREAT
ncbi:DUF2461 domain-containing protein [Hymenobacter weizhouensis]|uniref:DUF2461 domain-containing protein n=1 Tax=Hymenobacter sp. YIM 151500-1 TaxID=2987689 RepID=UPI002227E04A|nr:DUF2461 domain-containing protein [Hymenobacter sp. YIM 151500-1]UYZ65070.1 DUF2461 domain-containing protein [Hymenobacter sp. YIM 151500-1]